MVRTRPFQGRNAGFKSPYRYHMSDQLSRQSNRRAIRIVGYYAASRYALMGHEFKAHIAHHVNLWVVGSSPTSDAKEDPCAVIHILEESDVAWE